MKTKKQIIWIVVAAVIATGIILAITHLPSKIKNEARVAFAESVKAEAINNNNVSLELTESIRASREKLAVCLDSTILLNKKFQEITPVKKVSAGQIVVYGDTAFSPLGIMFRRICVINHKSRLPTGDSGFVAATLLRYFPDPDQAWAFRDSINKALKPASQTLSGRPTDVPAETTFNLNQGAVVLGYVNHNDSLVVIPTLLTDSLIFNSCPCEKCRQEMWSTDLKGINRLASTLSVDKQKRLPAPYLRIGALLIKIPGRNWQPLDQSKSFHIFQAGNVCVTLNDFVDCAKNNSGTILLKCTVFAATA